MLDTIIALDWPPNYDPKEGCHFHLRFTKARSVKGAEVSALDVRLQDTADKGLTWQVAHLEEHAWSKCGACWQRALRVSPSWRKHWAFPRVMPRSSKPSGEHRKGLMTCAQKFPVSCGKNPYPQERKLLPKSRTIPCGKWFPQGGNFCNLFPLFYAMPQ